MNDYIRNTYFDLEKSQTKIFIKHTPNFQSAPRLGIPEDSKLEDDLRKAFIDAYNKVLRVSKDYEMYTFRQNFRNLLFESENFYFNEASAIKDFIFENKTVLSQINTQLNECSHMHKSLAEQSQVISKQLDIQKKEIAKLDDYLKSFPTQLDKHDARLKKELSEKLKKQKKIFAKDTNELAFTNSRIQGIAEYSIELNSEKSRCETNIQGSTKDLKVVSGYYKVAKTLSNYHNFLLNYISKPPKEKGAYRESGYVSDIYYGEMLKTMLKRKLASSQQKYAGYHIITPDSKIPSKYMSNIDGKKGLPTAEEIAHSEQYKKSKHGSLFSYPNYIQVAESVSPKKTKSKFNFFK
jgi:hypothetical protein